MKGRIYIVGIGPGSREHMSGRAVEVLTSADIVTGYKTYTRLVAGFVDPEKIISSAMKQEVPRCREALSLASGGKSVALVSSGDPGIYGMAGLMLEIIARENAPVDVEVVPGITSLSAAAAILGAPVMHDFAVISLSDLLTDADLIATRLECAARGDFVVCIYNPQSASRTALIRKAREILLRHRGGDTPVGIVRNAMREGETRVVTTLEDMLDHPIDMTTIVIIGNSKTFVAGGRIITPRGYAV